MIVNPSTSSLFVGITEKHDDLFQDDYFIGKDSKSWSYSTQQYIWHENQSHQYGGTMIAPYDVIECWVDK